MQCGTHRGRLTLPFAPLKTAIDLRVRIRKEQLGATRRDLKDFLPEIQRKRYYRAARTGLITLGHAEDMCVEFGWHPREIWTDGAWDEHATKVGAA